MYYKDSDIKTINYQESPLSCLVVDTCEKMTIAGFFAMYDLRWWCKYANGPYKNLNSNATILLLPSGKIKGLKKNSGFYINRENKEPSCELKTFDNDQVISIQFLQDANNHQIIKLLLSNEIWRAIDNGNMFLLETIMKNPKLKKVGIHSLRVKNQNLMKYCVEAFDQVICKLCEQLQYKLKINKNEYRREKAGMVKVYFYSDGIYELSSEHAHHIKPSAEEKRKLKEKYKNCKHDIYKDFDNKVKKTIKFFKETINLLLSQCFYVEKVNYTKKVSTLVEETLQTVFSKNNIDSFVFAMHDNYRVKIVISFPAKGRSNKFISQNIELGFADLVNILLSSDVIKSNFIRGGLELLRDYANHQELIGLDQFQLSKAKEIIIERNANILASFVQSEILELYNLPPAQLKQSHKIGMML